MEKAETMTFLIPNFMGGSTGKSVLNDSEGNLNRDSETYKYLRTVRNQVNSKNYNNKPQVIGESTWNFTYICGSVLVFLFI